METLIRQDGTGGETYAGSYTADKVGKIYRAFATNRHRCGYDGDATRSDIAAAGIEAIRGSIELR